MIYTREAWEEAICLDVTSPSLFINGNILAWFYKIDHDFEGLIVNLLFIYMILLQARFFQRFWVVESADVWALKDWCFDAILYFVYVIRLRVHLLI